MESRVPNKLSDQELLDLLKSPTEVTQSDVTSHDQILNFISYYNIQEGKHKVKLTLLHKLFKNWNSKENIITSVFNARMKEVFPHSGSYVHINVGALNVSKQLYNLLNKPIPTPSPRLKAHITKFYDVHCIKSGDVWVYGRVIVYLYNQWCDKINKPKNYTESTISSLLKLFFNHKYVSYKGKKLMVYQINTNLNHFIPEEHQLEILNAKKRKANKKKTNPKI